MTRVAIISLMLATAHTAAAQTFTKTGTLAPNDLATLSVAIKTTSTVNDLRMGLGAASLPQNLGIGQDSLNSVSSGANNVCVGRYTGRLITTGYDNTCLGHEAGYSLTTGGDNTLLGDRAGRSLSTTNTAVAIGPLALYNATTGTSATAIGRGAAYNITNATNSIYIGGNCGFYIADGTTAHTVGTSNVFLGSNVRSFAATSDNAIAIGVGAIAEGSSTTTIGNTSTTQAHIFGALLHRRKVVNDTNGETLSASDASGVPGGANGQIYTNTGATGAQVFNLPAAAAGMVCTFYVSAAQDVDINPDNADIILGLTDAAGDAISSDATVGSRITLIAIDGVNWAAFDTAGTWTDVN